jgi:transcriptional regulator with XRE-family HTH domain
MSQIKNSMSDQAIVLEIGRRLKQARLEQNVTQQLMADEIGISRARYIRLEDGNGKIEVLVGALRMLNKLSALDAFLPEEPFSPVEALKLKGHQRKRARPESGQKDDGGLDW